jgi:phage-related protein
MSDKPIYWIGSSKQDIANFPTEARRKAGFELRAVQQGQLPADFKSMSIIGKGVEEIRIRTENAYRIFYVAKFSEAIYVLHAFQKKTQKTAKKDLQIGQQRYKQLIEYRQEQQLNNY